MKKGSRKWVWLAGSFGLLVIVALGVASVVWGDLIAGARELPRRTKEAQAAGLELDPGRFGKELEIPPADNAYLVLKPVFDAMESDKGFTSRDPKGILEAWKRHPGLYKTALAGTWKSGYFVDRDFSKGSAILFPDYAKAKSLAKALAAMARDASERSNVPDAQEAEFALAQLSRHIASEPLLIAQLVALALDAIRLASLWDIAVHHSEDPAWLAWIQRFSGLTPQLDLPATVRGEAVLGYVSLVTVDPFGRDWLKLFMLGEGFEKSQLPPVGPGSRDASLARYLDAMTRLYVKLKPERSPWKQVETAQHFEESVNLDKRPSTAALRLLTPVYAATATQFAVHPERCLTVEAGAWLLEQKAKKGSFPSTLPGRYKDLRYQRLPAGFKVYTRGADRADNGGPDQPGFHKAKKSDDFGILFQGKS